MTNKAFEVLGMFGLKQEDINKAIDKAKDMAKDVNVTVGGTTYSTKKA